MKKNISCFLPTVIMLIIGTSVPCLGADTSPTDTLAQMRDTHVALIGQADEKGLFPQIVACHAKMQQTDSRSAKGRCEQHRLRVYAAHCATKLCDAMPEHHRRELRNHADTMHAVRRTVAGDTCTENCGMLFI